MCSDELAAFVNWMILICYQNEAWGGGSSDLCSPELHCHPPGPISDQSNGEMFPDLLIGFPS